MSCQDTIGQKRRFVRAIVLQHLLMTHRLVKLHHRLPQLQLLIQKIQQREETPTTYHLRKHLIAQQKRILMQSKRNIFLFRLCNALFLCNQMILQIISLKLKSLQIKVIKFELDLISLESFAKCMEFCKLNFSTKNFVCIIFTLKI